ncbi:MULTISPECIES: hypothetical protein [Virgibacillus]|uniref:Uncharacterized protein n=2 Tax=Virgibacillus TaxID=84406 RepID=A0A024QE39_9BACI|nr:MULTISPECIES: hypothetical protein [Virgibacillus]EQB34960.1 hypothetical protein M948_17785 [Virgibacillus sp. CM-4]MYL42925.1 hypothetical protein [Virgibacillus massiliensis]GGJ70684.1 hypothetical protein GCM10007111_35320 [Virgibacillus kapii]CDQ40823.1 hypothetical protein BN990_03155 [Virgibacillus massiliensis]
MKQVFIMLLTVATILFASLSSVQAKSQLTGWDYVGYSIFFNTTGIAESTGGDFKYCLDAGPSGWYKLWEDDPVGDDFVGERYLSHGECAIFRNIGGFVDGSNNEAEFYVQKIHSTNVKSYMIFYD